MDHVDEDAAMAEQCQPPVLELRRHPIEQLRLIDATPYDDSLFVRTIDWYCIMLCTISIYSFQYYCN